MDRAHRRAATVLKASRIGCSLASNCANVNEFLWTNSYGLNCGEPHRVLQPRQARTDETRKLFRIGRLLCESVSRTCEALKRRRGGHAPIQSARVSALAERA